MSKDFIKDKVGQKDLIEARRQQSQLSYLTQSSIQEDVNLAYIEKITCGTEYRSDDPFLTWVNAVFKPDNFKTFFKYLRFPLATSRLVQDMIRPHLERVFFSEDGYFHYTIGGDRVPTPEELNTKEFDSILFDALLFRHNDILVHDLEAVNTPTRYIIDIKNVVAIESKDSKINRVAFTSTINDPNTGDPLDGYIYIDAEQYIFYDREFKLEPLVFPHDLGETPADYISGKPFDSKRDAIRASVFTYVREELEEYVFLKTLQRMTEPNGAIPTVTKLKSASKAGNVNQEGSTKKEQGPMSASSLKTDLRKTNGGAPTQTGTVHEVSAFRTDDGAIDMDAVKHFLNFHYMPVESLEFVNNRIKEIENNIVTSVVGDYQEQNNENSKNELQVNKSYDQKQDKLRRFALNLSRIRKLSDEKFLKLQHGPDRVQVDLSYGTDFFIESQEDLYMLFKESPNPIERQTILRRLAQNRGRFNKRRADRDELLYRLQPFSSDGDFQIARESNMVDDITMLLQLRLSYWLSIFESNYGDVLDFWEVLGDIDDNQKLVVITELLNQIIKDYVSDRQLNTGAESETE